MDQCAKREARQQTASVSRLWTARTGTPPGRAVAGRWWWRRGVGEEPYFLRGSRVEPLQQSAQHHPIFEGALQESFGIRDALLRGLQHPERNQPCHRLFRWIHVRAQRILLNKEAVLWVSLTARRPGYAGICASEEKHYDKKGCWRDQIWERILHLGWRWDERRTACWNPKSRLLPWSVSV